MDATYYFSSFQLYKQNELQDLFRTFRCSLHYCRCKCSKHRYAYGHLLQLKRVQVTFYSYIANTIQSLQGKASSVAASVTNTSPAAPSHTRSAGFSLNSGLAGTVLMQVIVLGYAFICTSLLA